MKETIDLLGKILTNILTALYEPFGFSFLLSFLAMFFYLYAYEPTAAGKGWKSAMYVGSDSIKKKINISKEFVNKIRGTVSFLRCSNNYTSLRGEQQATISYNRMRCDKY